MKLSRLFSLGFTVVGSVAAGRILARRGRWEEENRRVAICVDHDDLQAAATRAGLSFTHMVSRVAAAGATHISLPELTLQRLLARGRLVPRAPSAPLRSQPPVGHWNYLYGTPELATHLARELAARLPYTEAQVVEENTLAIAGDLLTIGEIGLGFEDTTAELIADQGLGIVPRPESYAWPEQALLARTLQQAARHGRLVAFAGEMILGHEMHLDETLAAMAAHDLSLVYFAESRHQKGDWFLAKRRLPHLVLGHRFSPAEMAPLDLHAAAHNWAHLARERGIRFCYVNFFRVLHATAPLEGLDYIAHLQAALEAEGFTVTADVTLPQPVPEPEIAELALSALAPAGVAAAAVQRTLGLPEPLALPLTFLAAGGAIALPFAEQAFHRARAQQAGQVDHHHPHDGHHQPEHAHHEQPDENHHHAPAHEHEHHGHAHDHDHPDLHTLYPPSYTPKLLALAAAALGPVAALAGQRPQPPPAALLPRLRWELARWPAPESECDRLTTYLPDLLYPAASALSLAAATSGGEYQLRVEEYRSFNLDWLLPLAAAATTIPQPPLRRAALAILAGGWLLARHQGRPDLLATLDPAHAQGHTHHISDAMRLVGDVGIWLGPRPARKWFGLGPLAQATHLVLARRGYHEGAAAAALVSALGYALGLTGFRRPERALQVTAAEGGVSFLLGASAGLLLLANGR